MIMGALRLNLPTILISGGPMLAGQNESGSLSLSSLFEAVGSYKSNMITETELSEIEQCACPSCGSCAGMYTANSMHCLTEAIGLALPGNGTTPEPYSARQRLAKASGVAIMELLRNDIRIKDIINEKSIRNAITCDMALGCSTNTVLHLLAIATEAGIDVDLRMFNEISEKTPNLCHLAPAGPTRMEDLFFAGGVAAVQKELAKKDLLDLDLLTVTNKTIRENIAPIEKKDNGAIRDINNPYSEVGGLAILYGNIAKYGDRKSVV